MGGLVGVCRRLPAGNRDAVPGKQLFSLVFVDFH